MLTKQDIINTANNDFNQELVRINSGRIKNIKWTEVKIALPAWDWALTDTLKQCNDYRPVIMYWLVAVAQAFRFWHSGADKGDIIKYLYKGESGSNAIFKGLTDAWGNDITPDTIRSRNFARDSFYEHFGDAPGLESRVDILKEMLTGNGLEEAADYFSLQSITGVLTVEDASWLADKFPLSYGNDPYLKKAQLLCAAVAGFISSRGNNVSTDLTAMSDYQVPRVLIALDVLEYGDRINTLIESGDLIEQGGAEELAIRSATILACEELGTKLDLPSSIIDNILWSSQELAGRAPFHLTVTTNY